MQSLTDFLNGLSGYRTYIAYAAAAATALGGYLGFVPGTTAQSLSVALIAAGGIFHRLASAQTQSDLTDALASLQRLEQSLVAPTNPPASSPAVSIEAAAESKAA